MTDGGRADSPDGHTVDVDEDDAVSVATQFYRAEVERMTTWRTRLDQTINWAVVVMAAILTWAFSSPDHPHYVLLIGLVAVGAFLVIEAQRYQEYDAWRARVRSIQENAIAPVFDPDGREQDQWNEHLGRDLRTPRLALSIWQSLAHRLQKVYFFLLTVLLAAWIVRITVFQAGEPWTRTASIAFVPGTAVVGVVGVAYLVAVGLTVWSFRRAPVREFEEDVPTDVASEPE